MDAKITEYILHSFQVLSIGNQSDVHRHCFKSDSKCGDFASSLFHQVDRFENALKAELGK